MEPSVVVRILLSGLPESYGGCAFKDGGHDGVFGGASWAFTFLADAYDTF